jgi:hypothetical protein
MMMVMDEEVMGAVVEVAMAEEAVAAMVAEVVEEGAVGDGETARSASNALIGF